MMGNGGRAEGRSRSPNNRLLGMLAFGILIVSGMNMVIFPSMVDREEENHIRDPDQTKKEIFVGRKVDIDIDTDSFARKTRRIASSALPNNTVRETPKQTEASKSSKNTKTNENETKNVNVNAGDSVPRDNAIYTCSYGKTNAQEDRTTVVIPKNTPSFVIIGVQKSGTTSLLSHCRDHPQMLPTKLKFTREAHFFDTSWQSKVIKEAETLGLTASNDKHCLALEQYMKLFETEIILANSQTMAIEMAHTKNENQNGNGNATHHLPLYTFEKTPTYFGNPKIPARMKRTIPWSKIILVLRNPTDRIYSQYKMSIKDVYDLRKYSLEDMVFHELKAMKEMHMTKAPLMVPVGNATATATAAGDPSIPVIAEHYQMPEHVPFDHAVLDAEKWRPKNMAILKKADDGPLKNQILVRRGLYSPQLRWWLQFYTVGEDMMVINYDELKNDTRAVYEKVLGFAGVPLPYDASKGQGPSDVGIDFDQLVRADQRKDDRPLRDSTREYLRAFYAPYTAELEALLGPAWSPGALGW